jgi:glycosyltransferase involved in cell wall biosynthesis
VRIVVAHDYYASGAPSGENVVYEAERDLLRAHDHHVVEFVRHNDELRGGLGPLRGGLAACWNPFTVAELGSLLDRERPEILHVHNFFPLLSPAVFGVAHRRAVGTVLTLHNYRLFCAAGTLVRNGSGCTLCIDRRSTFPGLRHGCYRQSRAASVPVAAMIAIHRWLGTWTRNVDAYVALTEFQRGLVVAAGLPAERVFVKPNFHPGPPRVVEWDNREPRVAFVGRVSVEKGVHVLLEAWRLWGPSAPILEIVGDGPERVALIERARTLGIQERVKFVGHLGHTDAQRHIGGSRLIVVPSLWFETFSLVLMEAMAMGVPAAVSEIGPLPALVDNGQTGLLFRPGDPKDLYTKVAALWSEPDRLQELGRRARAKFESEYTAKRNHALLSRIYDAVRARRRDVP